MPPATRGCPAGSFKSAATVATLPDPPCLGKRPAVLPVEVRLYWVPDRLRRTAGTSPRASSPTAPGQVLRRVNVPVEGVQHSEEADRQPTGGETAYPWWEADIQVVPRSPLALRHNDPFALAGQVRRPFPRQPNPGTTAGSRAARRRPRRTGASSGTSTRRSTSRSASGTRAGCRRRASAPRRGLTAPSRRPGPGARASPSSLRPGPSTRRRPCPCRPASRAGPRRTSRPSAPGTRRPASARPTLDGADRFNRAGHLGMRKRPLVQRRNGTFRRAGMTASPAGLSQQQFCATATS